MWDVDYHSNGKKPIKNDISKILSIYNCNNYIVECFNKISKIIISEILMKYKTIIDVKIWSK